jgi:hypothetical protein
LQVEAVGAFALPVLRKANNEDPFLPIFKEEIIKNITLCCRKTPWFSAFFYYIKIIYSYPLFIHQIHSPSIDLDIAGAKMPMPE